jgi:hypothetical protein
VRLFGILGWPPAGQERAILAAREVLDAEVDEIVERRDYSGSRFDEMTNRVASAPGGSRIGWRAAPTGTFLRSRLARLALQPLATPDLLLQHDVERHIGKLLPARLPLPLGPRCGEIDRLCVLVGRHERHLRCVAFCPAAQTLSRRMSAATLRSQAAPRYLLPSVTARAASASGEGAPSSRPRRAPLRQRRTSLASRGARRDAAHRCAEGRIECSHVALRRVGFPKVICHPPFIHRQMNVSGACRGPC